jgi:hypothetical protein
LKQFFGLKITNFDADPDPGSGMFLNLNPGSRINIPDPKDWKEGRPETKELLSKNTVLQGYQKFEFCFKYM